MLRKVYPTFLRKVYKTMLHKAYKSSTAEVYKNDISDGRLVYYNQSRAVCKVKNRIVSHFF